MLRHVLLCLYTKRQQPLNGLPPHIGQVARLCGSESGMATQQQASEMRYSNRQQPANGL